ncbi:hypothetical protein M9H77_18793 [Catharanthus roseus]|uniref:Uncharacterized protein n=1 Tax=Catharanthus roseus TaxID=4058 RepID=A0ACC0B8G2_CATRO|nr:hypothetical protein M9H77_18793 [Catharanthus roseus]
MWTKIEKKIEKELASSSNSKTLESSPVTSFDTPKATISDGKSHFRNRSFEAHPRRLNDTLLAYCIAYKTPIGMSPFRLLFGKSCQLPVQHRAYWAIKAFTFDLKKAGSNRKLQVIRQLLSLSWRLQRWCTTIANIVMNLCSISIITFAQLTLEYMGYC